MIKKDDNHADCFTVESEGHEVLVHYAKYADQWTVDCDSCFTNVETKKTMADAIASAVIHSMQD